MWQSVLINTERGLEKHKKCTIVLYEQFTDNKQLICKTVTVPADAEKKVAFLSFRKKNSN